MFPLPTATMQGWLPGFVGRFNREIRTIGIGGAFGRSDEATIGTEKCGMRHVTHHTLTTKATDTVAHERC